MVAASALLGGEGGWFACRLRKSVDHFSRTRVTKLLAGFLLDRFRIVLQRVNVMRKSFVFQPEFLDLSIERAMFLTLVRIDHCPIGAEDYVVGHPGGDQT